MRSRFSVTKQHRYRLKLEHLSTPKGESLDYPPLEFEFGNHGDIFQIVEKIRGRGDFDENTATAFSLGLKMFGEVMLENKDHPLFSAFRPEFRKFMKELKAGPAAP